MDRRFHPDLTRTDQTNTFQTRIWLTLGYQSWCNPDSSFLVLFLGAVGLGGDSLLLSPVVEPVVVEGEGWDSDDFSFLEVWEAVGHFESFDFAE